MAYPTIGRPTKSHTATNHRKHVSRVSSLTLDFNGVFAANAYGAQWAGPVCN